MDALQRLVEGGVVLGAMYVTGAGGFVYLATWVGKNWFIHYKKGENTPTMSTQAPEPPKK